ncbi:unnamed protein product [Rangifer tarandus platyrhynchus]|uniref:Uncharacterized protein n=1 Tax=Rangifer tarandus platyrhynchus TaxID=3082113 RepID=A0ABN8Y998_RANTA|nr:unnamed protein product [Rangifer tarandus platyrhynchus]
MRETQVRSLGQEDPLEKEMAAHSSTLAWRIPWTEEPGGLQSTGSQRVGHELSNFHSHFFFQVPLLLMAHKTSPLGPLTSNPVLLRCWDLPGETPLTSVEFCLDLWSPASPEHLMSLDTSFPWSSLQPPRHQFAQQILKMAFLKARKKSA